MTVLSIDPGDTSGLCEWSDEGVLLRTSRLYHEELLQILADYVTFSESGRISTVVIEDYTQRVQHQNQKGRKMKAPRGIGAAELFCRITGAELVKQSPQILRIAAMHSGTKIVSHFDDDVSAFLHGWYYFESIDIAPRI